MKTKSNLLVLCTTIVLFLVSSFSSSAQTKVFRFLDLQIEYPNNCSIIFAPEKESDALLGDSFSFNVSAVFSNGSDERMRVSVVDQSHYLLLSALLGDEDDEIPTSILLELNTRFLFLGYESMPNYSHVVESNSDAGDTLSYIDFTARYYRNKRSMYSDTIYHENIKGRILSFTFGPYLVSCVMEVPTTNNFDTLMGIINSLSYTSNYY